MIIDDFLSNFTEFRDYVSSLDYKGTVNPLDGVIYPNITTEIPNSIKEEVLHKISKTINKNIQLSIPMFLRLSPEGVLAPNEVHTDSIMGEYTFILYLIDGIQGIDCGTQIMEHISGMSSNPKNLEEQNIFEQDQRDRSKWKILQHYEMKANRGVLFPSEKFHKAVPVNGFGKDAIDGRLVLTMFFNVI